MRQQLFHRATAITNNHSRCHFHCDEITAKNNNLMTHTLSGSMCQEPATPWNGTYFINEFHEFTDFDRFSLFDKSSLLLPLFHQFLGIGSCKCHAQILQLSCCCYSILINRAFFMHKLIQMMWIKSNPFRWMYDVRHSATTIYYYSMKSDIKCDTLCIEIYVIMATIM